MGRCVLRAHIPPASQCALNCTALRTVHRRYKKGSHAKGRNVFLKDIEPFIKWLEEADEDDEEDEA